MKGGSKDPPYKWLDRALIRNPVIRQRIRRTDLEELDRRGPAGEPEAEDVVRVPAAVDEDTHLVVRDRTRRVLLTSGVESGELQVPDRSQQQLPGRIERLLVAVED